ncbi:helix-turn-helix domain-containing protein [Sinorhizobium meliloti]|uniref:helix-turn-helix transcriptional regulator n=1 Tax=Rhizobium meliloti TaxID=382 RepID=UPI000EFB717F|nr:helix-turn-helix transcriptional regulator [Sinorhizobium meliloti]RMC67255.1 helix-turn-helix domain-containing protein [Sinorhizobium meliloti]
MTIPFTEPHATSSIRQQTSSAASTIVYAAPDALRAARALVGLTQTQLAAFIGVSWRSLAACETGSGATLKTIAALRDYYELSGIELLGTVNLTTNEVEGAGARSKVPERHNRYERDWRLLPSGISFSAARALLGLEQRQVARGAGLTPRQIGNLERGMSFTRKGHDRLRDYFEESGVEFLSLEANSLYFGVGVRFACEQEPFELLPPPTPSPWGKH